MEDSCVRMDSVHDVTITLKEKNKVTEDTDQSEERFETSSQSHETQQSDNLQNGRNEFRSNAEQFKVDDPAATPNVQTTSRGVKRPSAAESKPPLTNEARITMSFHNVSYKVGKGVGSVPLCGKATLTILDDVSGIITPGLNALLGPTGSGKTTLLDVLAQRKNPKNLSNGFVLVNGETPPPNFRHLSGYVLQDCILSPHLTVRENLEFSANLRLPWSEFDRAARRRKVDQVIQQLRLESAADTLVGDELTRGVSGGERKRTNIGMEMILDPPVLFLDEPTSGLDANTANELLLLLSNLGKGGRNIIFSIHQPRHSIFLLFDHLIILNEGRFVYRGQADNAVNYFKSLGYECPPHQNPADFFLDIIGGSVELYNAIKRRSTIKRRTRSMSIRDIVKGYSLRRRDARKDSEDILNSKRAAKSLVEAFNDSPFNQEENEVLKEMKEQYKTKSDISSLQRIEIKTEHANGFFTQLKVVGRRTALNLIRSPVTTSLQMLVLVIFAVVIGVVFFQVNFTFSSGIQNRVGSAFFILAIQIMYNLTALGNLIEDRARFVHESISGYYRVSVYFIAQLFADLLPNRIVTNIVFGTIIYFMVGFQLEVEKFFFFMLVLILFALTGGTWIFLMSNLSSAYSTAFIIASLNFLLMVMFAGFLVNITSLVSWLEWIKYFSIMRYGINAFSVSELSGMVFIDDATFPGYDPSSEVPCLSVIDGTLIPRCVTADEYLTTQGVPLGTWGLWQNVVALGTILSTLLILSYITLRRINKYV